LDHPQTDRNNAFLLELVRRFPPASLQDRITKEGLLRLLEDAQFRQGLIKRILEYNKEPENKALGFFDEISEYISQFCHWVGTATSYHSQLADGLSGKFGEHTADELRVMTPAIIDFGPWPLKDWFRDEVRTPDQQAALIEKISLIRRRGRAIHGFIGFDPWRYLQEVKEGSPDDSFKVLQRAIEKRGFVGVKLYPPMGFRPSGNRQLSNSDFPDELVRLCKEDPMCKGHVGRALDDVLTKLYNYCDSNELAIMAHCADSIGSRPGYANRSAPELWEPVLKKFKKLRLNLGHFGGIWDFFFKPECLKSKNTKWPAQISNMMKPPISEMIKRYNNLFVDVGDFSGVLDRWNSEKCATEEIFKNLADLVRHYPQLRSRMMYGSDWMLLDREPQNDDYYKAMRQKFSDLLGPTDVNKFLGQNAATFLGLHRGQRTRDRIDRFYVKRDQKPPEFDRYLIS
jgi:predicted TIM-barrel fold metal-dependent hydrolase